MPQAAPDPADTQRLLHAVRAGDRAALDQLLQQHRAYLRGMVGLRLDPKLRARVDASDVVQEAQIEAVRRVEAYLERPALPFHLWLRQIAYDRLLMLRRQHVEAARRAVEREAVLPDESSMGLARFVLGSEPTPSQQLVQHELVARVRLALADLTDDDREILLMRTLEGLSNQETAQVLALDPAAASKRYGRALLRLRQVLKAQGLLEGEP
jgi:RNA polymerase sigma-70 factor (ECF subfamily)